MTYFELADELKKLVDPALVNVEVIEDYDVPPHACFVSGWFYPDFEEDDREPISIEIAINTHSDVPEADIEGIRKEFVLAVNHEMVHLEQFNEGRFIFVWNGPYGENPNEIEAYFREDKMEFIK